MIIDMHYCKEGNGTFRVFELTGKEFELLRFDR